MMRGLVCALMLASSGMAASGYGKTIYFSNLAWKVKVGSTPVGPGPNYFSDNANNVWVDSSGRLHLRITKTAGKWVCAEVVLQYSPGYGTYRFYLDSPVDNLDPGVVLGLFTWSDDPAYNNREMDIEFARWDKASNPNGQYTVQPYTTPGRQMLFIEPAGVPQSTHSFKWQSGSVQFQSLRGFAAAPSGTNLIAQQLFVSGVPPAGGENIRINLWLFQGKAPVNKNAAEVIINRFEFVP